MEATWHISDSSFGLMVVNVLPPVASINSLLMKHWCGHLISMSLALIIACKGSNQSIREDNKIFMFDEGERD